MKQIFFLLSSALQSVSLSFRGERRRWRRRRSEKVEKNRSRGSWVRARATCGRAPMSNFSLFIIELRNKKLLRKRFSLRSFIHDTLPRSKKALETRRRASRVNGRERNSNFNSKRIDSVAIAPLKCELRGDGNEIEKLLIDLIIDAPISVCYYSQASISCGRNASLFIRKSKLFIKKKESRLMQLEGDKTTRWLCDFCRMHSKACFFPWRSHRVIPVRHRDTPVESRICPIATRV